MILRRELLRASAASTFAISAGCAHIGGSSFEANCEKGALTTGEAIASGETYWPEYAADSGNTSATAEAGPSEGVLAWRFATCAPMGDTSPIVADGAVYVTTNGEPGTRAFDASTGEELWTADVVGHTPAPLAANGTVYVAGQSLTALDAFTGTRKWSFDRLEYVSSEGDHPERAGPIDTAPTIVDGMLYFCGGRDVPWLFAIDAPTGELDWRLQLPGRHLRSSPAIDSNAIYFVDDQDRVVSVDRVSGEINWTKSDFGHPTGTPSVDDNQLFVPDRERGVHALTPAGDTIWQSDYPGVGPVAVDSTKVYVADRTRVSAFDRGSGRQVWTFNAGSGARLGSPVIAGDLIYVGRGGNFVELDDGNKPRGWVIALDAITGDERWSFPTRGIPAGEGGPYAGTRSSLAIGAQTLFASTNAGDLYAIGEA